jgi:hypothetical protein
MRPRFSIRSLLILVSVISIACYVAFVRPTIFANRFSDAVIAKDFVRAESRFCDPSNHVLTESIDDGRAYRVKVLRSRRKWQDRCKLQHRMAVELEPEIQRSSKVRVAIMIEVIATPRGIKPGKPYPISFTR